MNRFGRSLKPYPGRAPRKYKDSSRAQITDAWTAWHEKKVEWDEEQLHLNIMAFGPGHHERYFPEEYDKAVPDEGCWIRILEEPHTEMKQRFRLPVMSMWRARPHTLNCSRYGNYSPKQAVIATPGGDLHLWPHEYVVVPDITPYIGEDGVTMHELGGSPIFDAHGEDQLFYLQSRGITRHDAALLLLNDLPDQNFVYFTFDPEIVDAFGEVGMPLWRHVQLHPRANGKPFALSINVSEDEEELVDA